MDRIAALEKLSPIVSQPAGNTRDAALRAAYLDLLTAEDRAEEIVRRCREWSRPAQTSPVLIVIRARCANEIP